MKKIILFALIAFQFSCNSDDSETSQNNTPLGKLIKIETTFTASGETDVVYNSYNYNDSGNLSEINSEIDNTTTFVRYSYNDEGQIWKENLSDGSFREYQYTNGLITSITFSNSDTNIVLINDSNSQLIQSKYYNGSIFLSEKNYTNDSSGNVLSIENGTSLTTYTYDNRNNPLYAAYQNQEFNKTFHVFALVPPTNTTNNIISKSGSFNATLTHTYNTNGFPITTQEVLPNGDIRSVIYTYQE
ncbi:hypothetical protein FG167_04715 [Lacinutrix sp. WUR7]|uniref:hypothetical protein n=1 Tax=Lacinutrix sp. WUR7 TaxID=2653681 RepID=UPI00193DE2E7|nr:hypothetical protein [Lacinutrix sp. WUR7]QRM88555.1 hypothetical protein FG167_04715 [Lacinutrix sp. WUR7]